jgi:hypothetical protein
MAFPDYSMMLVEVVDTETQAVSRYTYLFSNVNNARAAYRSEVGQPNRRVFLFEQPQPTKFKRNDTVPVVTNLDTWD